MELKVTHTELDEVYDITENNSELLKEEINYWLNQLSELKNVWSGDDASQFFDNATYFLKKMTSISDTYDCLNNFIRESNNKYRDNDESAKKDFEIVSEEDVIEKYV